MAIVFITSPTSGSQSIYRILSEYARELGDKLKMYRGSDISKFEEFNDQDTYVINFRDPRDIWCNQYYWLTQHDAPNEKAKNDRKARFDQGIDSSVLKSFKAFCNGSDKSSSLISQIIKKDIGGASVVCMVSYAQLCTKYELMIERLNEFFGVSLSCENNIVINAESPKGLKENNNWIGAAWSGCDVLPGRYRSELQPETIATLNEGLKDYLSLLKSADIEELGTLYLE